MVPEQCGTINIYSHVVHQGRLYGVQILILTFWSNTLYILKILKLDTKVW